MAIEQAKTYTRPNNSKGWFSDTQQGKAAVESIVTHMANTYLDNGQMKRKVEYLSENQVRVTQRWVNKSVKDAYDSDSTLADIKAKRIAYCEANQITIATGSETEVNSVSFGI
tara:strand:+ start:193 stop:531 length:339 start_codon:yes stop_codon:yes gene_type:complete